MPHVVLTISTDLRGSTRVCRHADDALLAWFDYDPFGEVLGASESVFAQRIVCRYVGQRYEPESGCYDYRARLYDTTLCRFVAVDPAHQTPSPYVYCADDPVDGVDRDGRGFTVVIYFPAQGTRDAFFRGYLEDAGEYIGFDLQARTPQVVIDHAPHKSGALKASLQEYGKLRAYAEHSGTRVDVPTTEALNKGELLNSAARQAIWQTVVSYLRRTSIDFDELSAPMQRRVMNILGPPVPRKPKGRTLSHVAIESRSGEPVTWEMIDEDLARIAPEGDRDADTVQRPAKRRKVRHGARRAVSGETASRVTQRQSASPVTWDEAHLALAELEDVAVGNPELTDEALGDIDLLTDILYERIEQWGQDPLGIGSGAPTSPQPNPATTSTTTTTTRNQPCLGDDD